MIGQGALHAKTATANVARVWLQLFVHLSHMHVQSGFFSKHLAAMLTWQVFDLEMDCLYVRRQVASGYEDEIALITREFSLAQMHKANVRV